MRRNVKRSNVVTIEIGSSELDDSPQMGCMPHGLPAWRGGTDRGKMDKLLGESIDFESLFACLGRESKKSFQCLFGPHFFRAWHIQEVAMLTLIFEYFLLTP